MTRKNRKHQRRKRESTSGLLPSQNPEWAHRDRAPLLYSTATGEPPLANHPALTTP